MSGAVRVEIGGLTKLDQLELESTEGLERARFVEETIGDRRLGELPLVTMVLQAAPAAFAALAGALAAWAAKTRRKQTIELTISAVSPDGARVDKTLKIVTSSSTDFKAELIEAAEHLLSRKSGAA